MLVISSPCLLRMSNNMIASKMHESRRINGLLPGLLLAYMKGNANLCRAIVRSGARLGVNNNQGINIFNYQVATKQLLFRLLGEPVSPPGIQCVCHSPLSV